MKPEMRMTDGANYGLTIVGIAFTQINLHHSKRVSAGLARRQSVVQTAIFLIQEPCNPGLCQGGGSMREAF